MTMYRPVGNTSRKRDRIGCSTPYQENNQWNPIIGGYTDIPLSEDSYLITMHGSKNTSPEQVFMMLFYRASEITKQNGSRYFTVEGIDGTHKVTNVVLPGFSSSQTNGYASINPNTYSGQFSSQTSGFHMPAQNITSSEPIMRTAIKILPKSAKPKKDKAVDADFILKHWASKVRK